MAKFELINGAWFNVESLEGVTKSQFNAKYKDKRKYPFNNDDTWDKLQKVIKKTPKKETK